MDASTDNDKRIFLAEHARRVERLHGLAEHIENYAGWLKTSIQSCPPDDMGKALDSGGYAIRIGRDAATVNQLVGEIEALRSVAFLIDQEEPPADGHVFECCGKVGRISRHEPWCPIGGAS